MSVHYKLIVILKTVKGFRSYYHSWNKYCSYSIKVPSGSRNLYLRPRHLRTRLFYGKSFGISRKSTTILKKRSLYNSTQKTHEHFTKLLCFSWLFQHSYEFFQQLRSRLSSLLTNTRRFCVCTKNSRRHSAMASNRKQL